MARLIKPMISFVVPAYNEEHELSDTLAAIDAKSQRPGMQAHTLRRASICSSLTPTRGSIEPM